MLSKVTVVDTFTKSKNNTKKEDILQALHSIGIAVSSTGIVAPDALPKARRYTVTVTSISGKLAIVHHGDRGVIMVKEVLLPYLIYNSFMDIQYVNGMTSFRTVVRGGTSFLFPRWIDGPCLMDFTTFIKILIGKRRSNRLVADDAVHLKRFLCTTGYEERLDA